VQQQVAGGIKKDFVNDAMTLFLNAYFQFNRIELRYFLKVQRSNFLLPGHEVAHSSETELLLCASLSSGVAADENNPHETNNGAHIPFSSDSERLIRNRHGLRRRSY
jgi:hypothetical protein